jgi:hypothetical protein
LKSKLTILDIPINGNETGDKKKSGNEYGLDWSMVFNTTFNNISVTSCQLVLLVVETGENHRPVASH